MPVTSRDAHALALALLAVAGGLALIAVGVILDPPLTLLRHLHRH